MAPSEVLAATLARSTDASAAVDARRAAEAAALAEDHAAVQDLARATERHKTAHYDLISARAHLNVARDALAAHGALIELLNTDPALVGDLYYLSCPPSVTTPYVTPESMAMLGCRGLIDRRHKPSPSVFSPKTPLTVVGWATLRLYREIVGAPLDSPAFAAAPTDTED